MEDTGEHLPFEGGRGHQAVLFPPTGPGHRTELPDQKRSDCCVPALGHGPDTDEHRNTVGSSRPVPMVEAGFSSAPTTAVTGPATSAGAAAVRPFSGRPEAADGRVVDASGCGPGPERGGGLPVCAPLCHRAPACAPMIHRRHNR